MANNNRSKQFAQSAENNKGPILEVLSKYLPSSGADLKCMEVASGTGQHVIHFAEAFPHISFQPSECNESSLSSIEAYLEASKLSNILPPVYVNVSFPLDQWNLPFQEYDFMININMIHISPWQCTLDLFLKAGQILKSNGILFTYGPYSVGGEISPESNVKFNSSLIERNSEWGLRDIDVLKGVASENNFTLEAIEDMPANNKTLVWRKL